MNPATRKESIDRRRELLEQRAEWADLHIGSLSALTQAMTVRWFSDGIDVTPDASSVCHKSNSRLLHMKALLSTLAVASLTYTSALAESPHLLPFQGRLTDPAGTSLPDGPRIVRFQIFGEPSGGSALWTGETHRVTINGGLVNVILGSKNPLPIDRPDQPARSFFDSSVYLQITVDADTNGVIDAADPPLLPRQTILPIVFASESARSRESANSLKLAGYDWSALLGTNDPTHASLDGGRISEASVTFDKLAFRPIGTKIGVGGLAASRTVGSYETTSTNIMEVEELAVSLSTSGRPTHLALTAGENSGRSSYLESFIGPNRGPSSSLFLYRDGAVVYEYIMGQFGGTAGGLEGLVIPSSSFQFFDFSSKGDHTYSIRMRAGTQGILFRIQNVRLVAYEL